MITLEELTTGRKTMTLEDLVDHYYDMWANAGFSKAGPKHDVMMSGDEVANFFIEEARDRGLAEEDDIQAEANTLAEAIDEKASKLAASFT